MRRLVKWGYKVGEVATKDEAKIDPKADLMIQVTSLPDPTKRTAMGVSLGCHVKGACMLQTDPDDLVSLATGVMARAGAKCPDPKEGIWGDLKKFVIDFCETNLQPLPADTDVSVERWLEQCKSYTDARRKELLTKYHAVLNRFDRRKYGRVKAFTKDETYEVTLDKDGSWLHKLPRGIYSRTDEFKCFTGPFFKAIEQEVFKLHWFIKKIPVRERPAYIMEKVLQIGAKISCTDYTSFEAHFRKKLMESVEIPMYKYMTQNLPAKHEFWKWLEWITGDQEIYYKFLKISLEATRMSGEMCTSLGNGFSNLMFMLFVMKMCNIEPEINGKGFVEGDDGLFSYFGNLLAQLFLDLGLNIKLEEVESLNEASFCGLIFDTEDMNNITNPIPAILDFGWTSRRHVSVSPKRHKEMLRAKSLSMWHQYPGCPLLSSLALYGLRVTSGITIRVNKMYMNEWQKDQLLAAIEYAEKHGISPTPIGMNTRHLVHKMFKITIEDQQSIEKYLDSLEKLQPIACDILDAYIPHGYKMDYYNYVRETDVLSKYRDYPFLDIDCKGHRDPVKYFEERPKFQDHITFRMRGKSHGVTASPLVGYSGASVQSQPIE